MTQKIILHTYWRSSASYRVRMALNLKGLAYESRFVHLVRDGGEQRAAGFLGKNPQGLIPVFEHGDIVISQSLAICEYIEETFPGHRLLPDDAPGRARVRALAQAIACDIHPLNNLRVLQWLTGPGEFDERKKRDWYRHWTESGLQAIERMLAHDKHTGRFCHGDEPGLADCCLLPQVYNARRFDCNLEGLTRILAICDALDSIAAIRDAAPESQPDADN